MRKLAALMFVGACFGSASVQSSAGQVVTGQSVIGQIVTSQTRADIELLNTAIPHP